MKPNYLTREVTIDKAGLATLGGRICAETAGNCTDDIASILCCLAAGAAVNAALAAEFFPGEESAAITITGEEFAVRSSFALRKAWERFRKSADASSTEDTRDAECALLGNAAAILLDVEDNLFGSDADEEKEENADA